jgi:hypothetical protein
LEDENFKRVRWLRNCRLDGWVCNNVTRNLQVQRDW